MFIIKKKKAKKGVSFYELIISLFLINLVIFSVLSVITMLLRGSMHVNENSKGAVAANSIMNLYMSDNIKETESTTSEFSESEDTDENSKIEKNKVSEIEFAGIKYYYLIEETWIKKSEDGKPGLNNVKLTVSLNEKFKTNKDEYLKKPDEQDITITTLRVCDKTEDGLKQFTDSSTGGSSSGGSTGGTTSNSGNDGKLYAKEEIPT